MKRWMAVLIVGTGLAAQLLGSAGPATANAGRRAAKDRTVDRIEVGLDVAGLWRDVGRLVGGLRVGLSPTGAGSRARSATRAHRRTGGRQLGPAAVPADPAPSDRVPADRVPAEPGLPAPDPTAQPLVASPPPPPAPAVTAANPPLILEGAGPPAPGNESLAANPAANPSSRGHSLGFWALCGFGGCLIVAGVVAGWRAPPWLGW